MSYKYKRKGKTDITKSGHTMFFDDILKDLKRKEYLESQLQANKKEIADRQHTEDKNTDLIHQLYDEIAELKGLVLAAKCPNCDGEGAYYDNYGNVCQCQWCYESKLLINKDKEGE